MIIGCYARPSLQADIKNVSMFQKIFVLFCPVRDIISVEKHHPFTLCPVRDKIFSSPYYVPDGTLVSGGILLSTDMLSPAGRKTTFFRPDFSKNEYYILTPHLGNREVQHPIIVLYYF